MGFPTKNLSSCVSEVPQCQRPRRHFFSCNTCILWPLNGRTMVGIQELLAHGHSPNASTPTVLVQLFSRHVLMSEENTKMSSHYKAPPTSRKKLVMGGCSTGGRLPNTEFRAKEEIFAPGFTEVDSSLHTQIQSFCRLNKSFHFKHNVNFRYIKSSLLK